MTFYKGNESGMAQGLLPPPYYWWLAGAMFGQMVEYWFYTGDETYNKVVTQGILAQVGPKNNFMPPNQTKTEVIISCSSPSHGLHVTMNVPLSWGHADFKRVTTIKHSGLLPLCLPPR